MTPTCTPLCSLSFQLTGTMTSSKILGAKGGRKSDCQPGSFHGKVEERHPTRPVACCKCASLAHVPLGSTDPAVKCFMCASVSSSVIWRQKSYFTGFLNK